MKRILESVDKNILVMGGFVLGIILLVIILSLVAKGGKSNSNLDYEELEEKMISAAKEYTNENPVVLPTNVGESVTFDVDELISNDKMKKLTSYVNDDSCSGEVIVTKTSDANYNYVAKLICDSYSKISLLDAITSKTVTSGKGLYHVNNTYYYRGEVDNNYLKIDDSLFRITSIDSQKNIHIVIDYTRDRVEWDNRYNIDTDSNAGKNIYDVSRIKETIDKNYNNSEFYPTLKKNIVMQKLCIGSRQKDENSNLVNPECKTTLENHYFGLLTVSEFVNVSLDPDCNKITDLTCANYNYLASGNSWWTLTPDSETTSKVYKYSDSMSLSNASSAAAVRFTAVLNNGVMLAGGNGTESDPYTLK